MKLVNKFLMGLLALSIVTMVSCTKGDDDGPAVDNTPKGKLSGMIFEQGSTSGQTEWTAQTITAIHDTTSSKVRILATNAAGDKISIVLSDTAVAVYTLYQNTTNYSTYTRAGMDSIPTTKSNDPLNQTTNEPGNSTVQITDNGKSDGVLKGIIHVLKWYYVGDSNNDDIKFATFNSTLEFEAPLSHQSAPNTGAELTAIIDGQTFDPENLFHSGNSITGISSGGQSISVSLPDNVTSGEHDIDFMTDYDVSYSSGTVAYTVEGTINIIAFDSFWGTASGTFQGTATPSGGGAEVSITNGAFSF